MNETPAISNTLDPPGGLPYWSGPLSQEEAEQIIMSIGEERIQRGGEEKRSDLEKALGNLQKIDLLHNTWFGRNYLNLIERCYGREIVFGMFVTYDPNINPEFQLDKAKAYIFREENKEAILSGGRPFNSDDDLDSHG